MSRAQEHTPSGQSPTSLCFDFCRDPQPPRSDLYRSYHPEMFDESSRRRVYGKNMHRNQRHILDDRSGRFIAPSPRSLSQPARAGATCSTTGTEAVAELVEATTASSVCVTALATCMWLWCGHFRAPCGSRTARDATETASVAPSSSGVLRRKAPPKRVQNASQPYIFRRLLVTKILKRKSCKIGPRRTTSAALAKKGTKCCGVTPSSMY